MSDPLTNYYYPTAIGYWVTSTEYPLSETVTAHSPCHVTSNRGQKIVHIFEIPDPNLPIHFVTFTALRRRWSHMQKIAFSHYEGNKVYWASAVSRDLCIGDPPKPHVTIFWPRIAYSLYKIYAATMTIKGSLYLSIPMLKRFSVAKKVQSKSVPEMAVFRKLKGPNIKYSHRDPQKSTSLPGTTSLDVFCVNIRLGV